MANGIYIFPAQVNNNSNKKNYPTHRFNPTQPDPHELGWIGLDLCNGLGWVEFFLTHHGGLGQKIPLTQPNPTHTHPLFTLMFHIFNPLACFFLFPDHDKFY